MPDTEKGGCPFSVSGIFFCNKPCPADLPAGAVIDRAMENVRHGLHDGRFSFVYSASDYIRRFLLPIHFLTLILPSPGS